MSASRPRRRREASPRNVRVDAARPAGRVGCRFLFTTAVLVSLALMALAPLYFVSRDVYEDDDAGERASDSLRQRAAAVAERASRNRHISAYNPIPGPDRTQGADDERQYLGRAALPLRPVPGTGEV